MARDRLRGLIYPARCPISAPQCHAASSSMPASVALATGDVYPPLIATTTGVRCASGTSHSPVRHAPSRVHPCMAHLQRSPPRDVTAHLVRSFNSSQGNTVRAKVKACFYSRVAPPARSRSPTHARPAAHRLASLTACPCLPSIALALSPSSARFASQPMIVSHLPFPFLRPVSRTRTPAVTSATSQVRNAFHRSPIHFPRAQQERP